MQFDGITLAGTPLHGYRVAGWLDGTTQARISWECGPPVGYDAPGAVWEPRTIVIRFDLELMQTPLDIDSFANTRLISAKIEPFETAPRSNGNG